VDVVCVTGFVSTAESGELLGQHRLRAGQRGAGFEQRQRFADSADQRNQGQLPPIDFITLTHARYGQLSLLH